MFANVGKSTTRDYRLLIFHKQIYYLVAWKFIKETLNATCRKALYRDNASLAIMRQM